MKVKKAGKDYQILFVKREELIQYDREMEELQIVPEDVKQSNLLDADAYYYFYVVTNPGLADVPAEYKGYIIAHKVDKVTCKFDCESLEKGIHIKDIIKIIDRVVNMCIDRGIMRVQFEHKGNSTLITAAKKLGFDVKSNAMIAQFDNTEVLSSAAGLLAV